MKKENIQLREQQNSVSEQKSTMEITNDYNDEATFPKREKEVQRINVYKNYIPLCLIGAVGLGICIYKYKQVKLMIQQQPVIKEKEIDPFDF
jgi:hypothetical protein